MYPIILTLLFACEDNKEEATCTFNGTEYAVGESFDADDGCNTCSCAQIEGEDPSISCTAMECGDLEIIDCTILEQEECESTEGCTPIWASPVMLDNENQCFLWANTIEGVGCMVSDQTCTEAITYAASPSDTSSCYGFGNGCIPTGWGDCSQGSFPECE